MPSHHAWNIARSSLTLAAAAAAPLLMGCGDDMTGVEFAMFSKASGDNQSAAVTLILPEPIIVQARSPNGSGIPGLAIIFVPIAGGGSPSPLVDTTDSDGLASASVTLSQVAGPVRIEASLADLPDSVLAFSATAEAGPPASFQRDSPSTQSGAPGDSLTFSVKVADAFGNPVPAVPINWEVMSGNGTLTSSSPTTDTLGMSSASMVLPSAFGRTTIVAMNTALDSLPFAALAVATASDPIGDTFNAPAPDMTALRAGPDGDEFFVEISFSGTIDNPLSAGPNPVVGFVDLDVDQDSTTGAFSATDFFRPDTTGSTGMGIEYLVSLLLNGDGTANVFDAFTGSVVGTVTPSYGDSTLSFRVPLALLGDDDGFINVASVMGDSGPTDIVPNAGHLRVGGSAVPFRVSVEERDAPPPLPKLDWLQKWGSLRIRR